MIFCFFSNLSLLNKKNGKLFHLNTEKHYNRSECLHILAGVKFNFSTGN